MNPRSAQDILLEYFSANRGPVEIAPQLSTEVVLNPPDLSVPGAPGSVSAVHCTPENSSRSTIVTGTQKSVDNMGGRVEKFRNRFGKPAAK